MPDAAPALRSGNQLPMARYRGRTVCPATGKLRYGDQLAAERAIARAVVSGDPLRRECRAYFCQGCAAFHLTSRIG